MNLLSRIIPILLLPLASVGQLKTDHSMAGYGYEAGSKMNLEKLVSLFQTQKAQNIDAALRILKAEAPEYFENFILMYRSQSLQESSTQAPRVLLFDRSAEMVLTFNGDPQHRGFQKLELMQFRPETLKFEFRELEFIEGQLKVSEANPKACMQCHQSASRHDNDPRPNWEPYNVWPGAYGSNSGSLWPMSYVDREKLRPEDKLLIEEQKNEKSELTQFWKQTRPRHARYQLLDFPNPQDQSEDTQFERMAHQTVSFTDLVSNLSLRRMIRLARQDSPVTFDKIKYNAIHLFRCQELAMPDSLRKILIQRVNQQGIFKFATERTQRDYPAHQYGGEHNEYVEHIPRGPMPPAWEQTFSEQLSLLFEGLGISTLDWSTDFGTRGRFAFRERFGRPSNMNVVSFLVEVQEPEFSHLNCAELKIKALAEAADLEAEIIKRPSFMQPQAAMVSPERLLQRCATCHNEATRSSSGAPWIPFDQPRELASYLERPARSRAQSLLAEIEYRLGDHATLSEQMPPSLRRPEPEERKALLDYLRALTP